MGPVRGDAGPGLLKTSHTHVGSQLGHGLGASSQAPQLLRGDMRAQAGPLCLFGLVWAWGFSVLRSAPFSCPPLRGLDLSRPVSGSLVPPGLRVAVSFSVSLSDSLSLSISVCLQLLPCLKLPSCPWSKLGREVTLHEALGAVCDPAQATLKGPGLWPETPSWTESGSRSTWAWIRHWVSHPRPWVPGITRESALGP